MFPPPDTGGGSAGTITILVTYVLCVFGTVRWCSLHTDIVRGAAPRWTRGEGVEWNKKLAAEYTESALKIKGRLDELTAQINARRNPKGWIDKETERLLIRRATLYKMYGDTIHIAHILDNYYVDK